MDLEASDGRKDTLVADASRRQALFVAGGSTQERTQAKARAIAERFRALADAGQPQGGMVLLLGRMTNADVYAQAFRDQGLDCVIAGGSVFAQAAEVQTVRALVCALANPADTAQGLMPLLASPMFALGAQEFLALATKLDSETGETSRRNIDVGIMSDFDVPGLQDLPLVTRAPRGVALCASSCGPRFVRRHRARCGQRLRLVRASGAAWSRGQGHRRQRAQGARCCG